MADLITKKQLKKEFPWMNDTYIYRRTKERLMPHYKEGKILLFDLDEVKKWLRSYRVETKEEITLSTVSRYLLK